MKSEALLAAGLLLTQTVWAATNQPAPTGATARPLVKAQPFRPADVRLLDGPFLDNQRRDIDYLLSIDSDRLLHMFRVTAGLPSKAQPLGGWESPTCWVRGHSMGHYLTACALMFAATGDERLKTKADALVVELDKCQAALQKQGANPGYLSAYPEAFFDNLDANRATWAPWYVIHKIMAGLLDMHVHAGNRQALDVLVRMADWVRFRVDRRTEVQMQQSLKCEFGGMNEVLANLCAVTGNPDHLRLARAFDHKEVFDPLATGEDRLDGLHANTQIPKVIGAAREFELTGEPRYRDIATFFWRNVALQRSFVLGGNSDREHFFPVKAFSQHLSPMAQETCNTYNMLKLTRHAFAWDPTAETMDFYERGLFNHILGSQDPVKGTGIYFASLRPGHFKFYGLPFDAFWCCTGTGMENPARYGEAIYFHSDRELYVNLFMASRLTWVDKGLVVTQDTRFPEQDATRLTFSCRHPVALAVKLRRPAWARNGMTVTVNGQPQPIAGQPGSYVTVDRTWRDGDRLDISLPMALHVEAMPDDPRTVALLYGPIVLAGELGGDGGTSNAYLMSNANGLWVRAPEAPMLAGDATNVLSHIEPVPGRPLSFRSVGIGRPGDVSLVPYYRLHHQRFTVYWKLCTDLEWRDVAARRAKAVIERQRLEPRIVDEILFGDGRSEYEHKLQGDRRSSEAFRNRIWCESARGAGGFLSLEFKVKADRPMSLQCTYWGAETEFTVGMFTGRMSPTGPRAFDILIDGKKIAEQKLTPNESSEAFFDVDYAIPEELTRGKKQVTVTFQAHKDGTAGRLFGCLMLQAQP
jgi:DUF1680 family protein